MKDSTEKCCEHSGPGFTCPITGFRFCFNKCFVVSSLAMIVWTSLFSWFWHGKVMKEAYIATASLWRPELEMIGGALHGGMALSAVIATYIFIKGYEGRGIKEGLRFGIILTLLFLGCGLVAHATQPIPMSIIQMWALGDLIMYSLGGVLLGMLMKKCGK